MNRVGSSRNNENDAAQKAIFAIFGSGVVSPFMLLSSAIRRSWDLQTATKSVLEHFAESAIPSKREQTVLRLSPRQRTVFQRQTHGQLAH